MDVRQQRRCRRTVRTRTVRRTLAATRTAAATATRAVANGRRWRRFGRWQFGDGNDDGRGHRGLLGVPAGRTTAIDGRCTPIAPCHGPVKQRRRSLEVATSCLRMTVTTEMRSVWTVLSNYIFTIYTASEIRWYSTQYIQPRRYMLNDYFHFLSLRNEKSFWRHNSFCFFDVVVLSRLCAIRQKTRFTMCFSFHRLLAFCLFHAHAHAALFFLVISACSTWLMLWIPKPNNTPQRVC